MDTFYEKEMSQLNREYESYIAQAENRNRRNGYRVTPEEYQLYKKAAGVARKISSMNTAQRALCQQWLGRADMCDRKALNILRILTPEPEKEMHPSETPQEKSSEDIPESPSETSFAKPVNEKPVTGGVQVSESSSGKSDDGIYTVTASGFRTRNATDDVSAETIERWYKSRPKHNLSDVVGMDEMKKIIRNELLDDIGWDKTDEYLKIDKLKAFLFYGPFGTGKSYFIEAVASELMERGFKFIQLRGSDVHNSYVGVGEKIVQTAFQEAVDNAPCILFFDEFEEMCTNRTGSSEGHEKRLTVAFMEAYNIIVECEKPIVFFAATNYPDRIEQAMMSRIKTFVPVPLPSEEVRTEYFKKSLEGISLDDGFDYEYMVDETDNYSIRDLKRTVDRIRNDTKNIGREKYSVYDDEGKLISDKSDENVKDALSMGQIRLTREMFDEIRKAVPPEKKSDIMASLEAFEKKK